MRPYFFEFLTIFLFFPRIDLKSPLSPCAWSGSRSCNGQLCTLQERHQRNCVKISTRNRGVRKSLEISWALEKCKNRKTSHFSPVGRKRQSLGSGSCWNTSWKSQISVETPVEKVKNHPALGKNVGTGVNRGSSSKFKKFRVQNLSALGFVTPSLGSIQFFSQRGCFAKLKFAKQLLV